MVNGYFVGIIALFGVYTLLHHKKTAFYEVDVEIDDGGESCEGFGKTNFVPREQQNQLYECFEDIKVQCDENAKYRQIGGYCNNLKYPLWGGAHTAYLRIGEAFYDGYYGLRKGVNGGPLPLVRKIGTEIFTFNKPISENKTMLLTSFGQMVAHDVGGATIKQVADCCLDLDRGTELFMTTCAQLDIPEDDPFYSKINTTCIDLQRHLNTYRDMNCTILKSPHITLRMTSYLDLSFLYGYDDATVESSAREYEGGRFRIGNDTEDGPVLPFVEGGCPAKTRIPPQPICFSAGDTRINQNPEITVYTTIFLRTHNHIAAELEKLHPDWNDTILFEETRRIHIAAYQRFLYNEFLPALLGKENSERRGFLDEADGYSDQYDPEVNAQSIISFVSGAFRALHTLQPGNVTLRDNDYKPTTYYRSMDHFNNQEFLVTVPHVYTQIINGFVRNKAIDIIGKHAAYDLRNVCFNDFSDNFMTDLFSVDLNRGRDEGLPPYNAMRRYCGLCPLTSFDQLGEGNRPKDAKKLENLYDSIEDVDLLVGVFMETPVLHSVFGPTGQCLFEEAFSRYKKGDRFFYEYNNEPVSFTEEQLKAIKQVTFSSFICIAQNNPELEIQIDPFHQPSLNNPTKKCKDIPFLNLTLF